MNDYYLYSYTVENKVIYIGKGCNNPDYAHTQFQRAYDIRGHKEELASLASKITVQILDTGLSKELCVLGERLLIRVLQPKYNEHHTLKMYWSAYSCTVKEGSVLKPSDTWRLVGNRLYARHSCEFKDISRTVRRATGLTVEKLLSYTTTWYARGRAEDFIRLIPYTFNLHGRFWHATIKGQRLRITDTAKGIRFDLEQKFTNGRQAPDWIDADGFPEWWSRQRLDGLFSRMDVHVCKYTARDRETFASWLAGEAVDVSTRADRRWYNLYNYSLRFPYSVYEQVRQAIKHTGLGLPL